MCGKLPPTVAAPAVWRRRHAVLAVCRGAILDRCNQMWQIEIQQLKFPENALIEGCVRGNENRIHLEDLSYFRKNKWQ